MTEYETRTVTAEVEVRGDDSSPTIVGHAATFLEPYQVGYFTEQIHPQAFDRTLRRDDSGRVLSDVRLLVDHEGQPLARTKSGTLRLGTDSRGLTVEADLDLGNPKAQEITSALRRGDLDQMSFGFRVPIGGDTWDHASEPPVRTIREANLSGGDVSIVTYPANENTAVHLRSQDVRDAHFTLAVAMITELRDGRAIDSERLMRVLAELRGLDSATFVANTTNSYTLGHPIIATTTIGVQEREVVAAIEQATSTLPAELAQRLNQAAALRRTA